MLEGQVIPEGQLEAHSPFELRVNPGPALAESDVRTALATGDMGFLHSFTTGATVDGPGVRVVAWTSGCMWRCRYCHNPDTWTMSNGIPISIEKATEELRKYRYGLKVMAGGFTLSGGEPLMQHRFAAKLFAAAHGMGIHTALDTNGYYGDRLSDAELETIDLVLLDLKTWDPERHKQLTGVDNAATLAFARRLAARAAADLGALRAGALVDRRSRGRREDRGIRRVARQRGACRRAAVPPDGTVQVAQAGPRVHARGRAAAGRRSGRAGLRPVSRRRARGPLTRGRRWSRHSSPPGASWRCAWPSMPAAWRALCVSCAASPLSRSPHGSGPRRGCSCSSPPGWCSCTSLEIAVWAAFYAWKGAMADMHVGPVLQRRHLHDHRLW